MHSKIKQDFNRLRGKRFTEFFSFGKENFMIHVCYALFDRDGTYSKFIGTSILSMFENTQEKVTIHLIHDSTLTDENRKKFMRLVLDYDQDISMKFEKIPI